MASSDADVTGEWTKAGQKKKRCPTSTDAANAAGANLHQQLSGGTSKNEMEGSLSFESFRRRLIIHRFEIHAFDPDKGCVAGKWSDAPLGNKSISKLKQNKEEVTKRQRQLESLLITEFVKLVVMFEGYIYDLFTEAFDFVIEKIGDINEPDQIQIQHRDKALHGLTPTFRSIQNTLTQLFAVGHGSRDGTAAEGESAPEAFPLRTMIVNESFNVWFYTPQGDQMTTLFTARDLAGVAHILDLFYVIRCMAVHDKVSPTVEEFLKNFPQSVSGLRIGNDVVAHYMFDLYARRLKIQERCKKIIRFDDEDADNDDGDKQDGVAEEDDDDPPCVDYYLCANACHFYRMFSENLMRAVGYYLCNQLGYKNNGSVDRFWGLRWNPKEARMSVPTGLREFAEANKKTVGEKRNERQSRKVNPMSNEDRK